MKVYRIWNEKSKSWMYSRNNQEGYYTNLSSAKKALAQYKSGHWGKRQDFYIFEYYLLNEGIVE